MAVTKSQELKDSSTFDSRASKHSKKKNVKKNQKGNTNSSPISTKLTGGAHVQTVAVVSPLGKTNKVVPFLDDLAGEDSSNMLKEGALTKVDLTGKDPNDLSKEIEELTDANSLKPKEVTTDDDDGVLNGSSNKLADKLKDIDMGWAKIVPASSTKPVSNQDGVEVANDGVLNGSSTDLANKSKEIDMDGVGPEVILVLATNPVPNKGGVGFTGVRETIQNKEDNHTVNNTAFKSRPSIQVTLAALKKIIPVWTIQQHKPRSVASVAIPNQV